MKLKINKKLYKVLALILLFSLFYIIYTIFYKNIPSHLSELDGENSDFVISFNNNVEKNKYFSNTLEAYMNELYLYRTSPEYIKEKNSLIYLYNKYLLSEKLGFSYSFTANTPGILSQIKNGSDGPFFDILGSHSLSLSLPDNKCINIVKGLQSGFISNKIFSNEEGNRMGDFLEKSFQQKDPDTFMSILESNSFDLGAMMKSEYRENDKYFNVVTKIVNGISTNKSGLNFKLDSTNSIKGKFIDSTNFKNFSKDVDMDSNYIFFALGNLTKVKSVLNSFFGDSASISSFLRSNMSYEFSGFTNKLDSITNLLLDSNYVGMYLYKDKTIFDFKIVLNANNIGYLNDFKNTIQIPLDTYIYEFKKDSKMELSRTTDKSILKFGEYLNSVIDKINTNISIKGNSLVLETQIDIINEDTFFTLLKELQNKNSITQQNASFGGGDNIGQENW